MRGRRIGVHRSRGTRRSRALPRPRRRSASSGRGRSRLAPHASKLVLGDLQLVANDVEPLDDFVALTLVARNLVPGALFGCACAVAFILGVTDAGVVDLVDAGGGVAAV